LGSDLLKKRNNMNLAIQLEQEDDGRWLAEVLELPGTMIYGQTRDEATAKVKALALRVIAERLENGESNSDLESVYFIAA
jgi:predicted RNase H-like HicB family nuclease